MPFALPVEDVAPVPETSDRTLSFTYGPEHQRVKQVVNLNNHAPTAMMGDTTWYLQGANNNPAFYPQHAYVIVLDTISGEEWISRAGPGGPAGDRLFGSIKAVTTLNMPGSTLGYKPQVNARFLIYGSDLTGSQVAAQLSTFGNWANSQQIP